LKQGANKRLVLDKSDVREIFVGLSGMSSEDLDGDNSELLLGLADSVKEDIFGQDQVIDAVCDSIIAGKAGVKEPNVPVASAMCLGTSGVGKTLLGETLAEKLYKSKEAITVFDMSEFDKDFKVALLTGGVPGYVGYGQGGRLTNAMRKNPEQVILLDEVEKADPKVFYILLQILDKGRLTDELGTVSFKRATIIMTTNKGKQLAMEGKTDFRSPKGREAIIQELKEFFLIEMLNRTDEFLLFNTLSRDNVQNAAKRALKKLNSRENFVERKIRVDLPDQDIEQIVSDRYRIEEGARPVTKFIQNTLGGKLGKMILASKGQSGVISARYSPEKNSFDLDFVPSEGGILVAANTNDRQQPTAGMAFAKAAP
jgi:ATP-dependent Clp protease ATP-binding subunit ClpB